MIGADFDEIAGTVAAEKLADTGLLFLVRWMDCHFRPLFCP